MLFLFLYHLFIARAFTPIPGFVRDLPVHVAVNMTQFSIEEYYTIVRAANDWNNAVGRQLIAIWPDYWGTRDHSGYGPYMSTISKSFETPSAQTILRATYGDGRWHVSKSETEINPRFKSFAFANTIRHEFGHCLGLDHNASSAIMGHVLILNRSSGIPLFENGPLPVETDDVMGLYVWLPFVRDFPVMSG